MKVEGGYPSHIILDGVAVLTVLPNGDLGSGESGGRVGLPVIRVNEVGGSHSVIFRKGRGYG